MLKTVPSILSVLSPQLRADVEDALEQLQPLSADILTSNQLLASKLGRLGYKTAVRTALGGGEQQGLLQNTVLLCYIVFFGGKWAMSCPRHDQDGWPQTWGSDMAMLAGAKALALPDVVV